MKTIATLALGVCMTAAFAGASFAQSSSSSTLSASDQATMQRCQGMSPSAMQSDAQCTAFMKQHPDMMKSGTTGSSSGMSGSSGAGSSASGGSNSNSSSGK